MCKFVDTKTNDNATITKDLEVGVLATKQGSKATVIKPENKKKIIG